MTEPRSIRFAPSTLEKLAVYAAAHTGLTSSSAAALLVEEGLRMNDHPGIVFRSGPAGRRAALVRGPDVWEVIMAVIQVRTNEKDLTPVEVSVFVAEVSGITIHEVNASVAYYADYQNEIQNLIEANYNAEIDCERRNLVERELLGS